MPIYEYACDACKHKFEKFQSVSAKPITECPKCKKKAAKRLISASTFHLKGGGWFKEGYSKTQSKASGDSKAPAVSSTSPSS